MSAWAARGPGPQLILSRIAADASSSGRQDRTRSRIISTILSPTGMRRSRVCASSNSCEVKTAVASFSVAPVVAIRMSFSVSRSGYGTSICTRNRSSCASGSGYVPSCSIGFCVASTWNGAPSGRFWPAMVTCFSCMACRRADWVRGDARLISSAISSWQNTGPWIKRKLRVPSASVSRISEPRMSAGIRSGVN